MYIDIDDIPGPGRRNIIPMVPCDRKPWVFPYRRPDGGRPIIPFPSPGKPFIPSVPIPDDDEYPVSKTQIEDEVIEKEKSLHDSIMKNSHKKLNKGLRAGQRNFPIIEIDGRIRNKEVDMLISEYKAAGWKVEHKQKDRPGDPTDGWNYLEFK